MDSIFCSVSLLEDKGKSFSMDIVRDNDGKQLWKVISISKNGIALPAFEGTWFRHLDAGEFWCSYSPTPTTETTVLVASGMKFDFFRDVTCGRPLKANGNVYDISSQPLFVSCKFSLLCI